MAYDLPKLLSRIKVPPGGWTMSVTDSGGTELFTIPAGLYYLPDLLEEITDGLTGLGALALTYSSTRDDTAQHATGRITLAATGTFSVTWGSAALAALLGYSGNLSGSASYQAPKAARSVFLPDVPIANPKVPDGCPGLPIGNTSVVVATTGDSQVLDYGDRGVGGWEWLGLSGRKTWTQFETYTNESFQSFWRYALRPGTPFRYVWDRTADDTDPTNYTEWRLVSSPVFPVAPDLPGFVGGPGAEGAALKWNVGPLDLLSWGWVSS